MKVLLFISILFCYLSCNAQDTLYHMVNGKHVAFTKAETIEWHKEQALNRQQQVKDSIGESNKRFALAIARQRAKSALDGLDSSGVTVAKLLTYIRYIAAKNGDIDSVTFRFRIK